MLGERDLHGRQTAAASPWRSARVITRASMSETRCSPCSTRFTVSSASGGRCERLARALPPNRRALCGTHDCA